MGGDRLLIVDEDVEFRTLARRVAEALGYDTLLTGDAKVFKEEVRSWHPSVVIIDLNPTGIDGIELLRELGEMRIAARIVIASGVDAKILDTVGCLAAERGLSVAATLQKPVGADALGQVLDRLREVEKQLLAGALAHAIANDDLVLEYLPTIDCRSGRIYAVEALVRWQHPTRGTIPPDQFLSLAEAGDLGNRLTEWVVAAATAQTARWRRQGVALGLSVNVSPGNLESQQFPDMLAALCARNGHQPAQLTVEFGAAAAAADLAQMRDTLSRLRLKGFRLAIDGFGSGDLSLAKLRRLPFSEVKIDKPFVSQMTTDRDSRLVVEAAIELAHKFGLQAVAVGVTTPAILAAIVELGADAAQGFLISPPVGADRIGKIAAAPVAIAAPS